VTRTLTSEFRLTDLRAHLRRSRAYPSGLPLLHLDHIYYDHHFEVESARFHRSRLSLVASDHLPLVADLVMGGSSWPAATRDVSGSRGALVPDADA
jgi:endonuclease/exonuclease/phosphatase family metal-dependent hydrolase